ncbi:hypothetical protein LshimejAT787_0802660 [Lyophyllum shimeji]|uniref:Uncharacterized protein n=1 Tax=Lyophyllum shimeji TaxID=47721 RepID=A0A9P3PPR7_LYOSH|nr:hypothetical protein LshimejAT787_0802660 [Lyophyllum shimeji]
MAPSRTLIQYFSVMAESLLLGVYLVLVFVVCWILKTRHRNMPTMHKILFGASITMWFIAAAHLALLIQEASVGVKPSRPVGQAVILLSMFQFVIGDLILIWRVWVIWNRNFWIAAGPFALMVTAAAFTCKMAVAPETHNSFFSTVPVVLIVANTSICTLLIAGRVWFMQYRLKKISDGVLVSSQSCFGGAVALLMESGALYATCQLISLVLNYVGSTGVSVMLNLEIPLIGILPTLIIVLVHFNMVPGTDTSQSYAATLNFQTTAGVTLDTVVTGQLTTVQSDRSSKAIQVDMWPPRSGSDSGGGGYELSQIV